MIGTRTIHVAYIYSGEEGGGGVGVDGVIAPLEEL